MNSQQHLDIKPIDPNTLLFIYLLPCSFFPLTTLFSLFKGDAFFALVLNNIIFSIVFILTPLLFSSGMLLAKYLHRDPNRHEHLLSISLGSICCVFMLAMYTFLLNKFPLATLNLDMILQGSLIAGAISCVLAMLWFTVQYIRASKHTPLRLHRKILHLTIAWLPSLSIVLPIQWAILG